MRATVAHDGRGNRPRRRRRGRSGTAADACSAMRSAPGLAHLGEDGPGDAGLRADRIEMGADRAGAMGEGAAEREIHAGAHVLGRPVRVAVAADVVERAAGRCRPDCGVAARYGPCRDGCGCRRGGARRCRRRDRRRAAPCRGSTVPARTTETTSPSSIAMSSRGEALPVGAAGRRSSRAPAGARAFVSRSAERPEARRSPVPISALPRQRALVPAAQEKVGEGGEQEEDQHAGRGERAPEPRTGAGC